MDLTHLSEHFCYGWVKSPVHKRVRKAAKVLFSGPTTKRERGGGVRAKPVRKKIDFIFFCGFPKYIGFVTAFDLNKCLKHVDFYFLVYISIRVKSLKKERHGMEIDKFAFF